MSKQYGEFDCPHCDQTFFEKKKLDGHIGGAHKRNTTKDGITKCKFCNAKLIEGGNWAAWAIKQRNLICIPCKRRQNRESYRNRLKTKKTKTLKKFAKLKERIKHGKNTNS